MPSVSVSSPSESIRIYWRNNFNDDLQATHRNGTPTLLFLNPGMLSIDFIPQFEDPVMQSYNLIGLDLPTYGQTQAPLFASREQGGTFDDWSAAALIGDFCLSLGLPPVHVIAPILYSSGWATRFAILFPDLCRSLVISSVREGPLSPAFAQAWQDIGTKWMASTSLVDLEELCENIAFIFFGDKLSIEEKDAVFSHWVTHYAPKYATRNMGTGPLIMTRAALRSDQASRIIAAVTVLQPDRTVWLTPDMAHHVASLLSNAKAPGSLDSTGPQVHIIPDGVETMMILSHYGPAINELIAKHIELSIMSAAPSPTAMRSRGASMSVTSAAVASQGSTSLNEVSDRLRVASLEEAEIVSRRANAMKEALEELARMEGRPEIASRDPRSVFSFSLRSPETIALVCEKWLFPWRDLERAGGFSPETPDGQPPRPISKGEDAVLPRRFSNPSVPTTIKVEFDKRTET